MVLNFPPSSSQNMNSDVAAALVESLHRHAPPLLRWGGAIAKKMRQFNIKLDGKTSGSALTDALTLADITIQELLVAGLRDSDPRFRKCRIEAEESNGDIDAFSAESPWTIALDPIDGTKQFSDHSGNGYAVMLHLRTREQVLYSLVFAPEMGEQGTWVEVYDGVVKCGEDNPRLPANVCLTNMPNILHAPRPKSNKYYLIGFIKKDVQRAREVTGLGLHGYAPDEMPGSIYPLMATGEFAGSLIHTPNIYDYPVSLHLARVLGGESLWAKSGEPVHFGETWLDEKADMLRLPGIAATSVNREDLPKLCELAKDWNPDRYAEA
jgi:3'(2'), 5'-bisphosphate nucleotidase